jgi:hypothetical protein
MGYNLGVYSKQSSEILDCDQFIERTFFNFVCSYENYGNESILIQSGKYYNLDLLPLTKYVYSWDAPDEVYINENIQETNTLLNLTIELRNKIISDNSVCDKINYTWYDKPYLFDEEEISSLKKEIGSTAINSFVKENEQMQKQISDNPNPWKNYFETLQILSDLESLIKSLQCYKDNGIEEIYLTAG